MLTALAVLPLHDRLACRGHRAVALENLALRQQLYALKRRIKRPTLRRRDRLFWIVLATAWRDWRIALLFVQPDTVVRWHHQWLRRRWTQRSRQTRQDWPSTAAAIRTLVDDMRAANPLWGAPRLHGELLKLGIDIGESRVSKYMVRRRPPPSQTWRRFLENHLRDMSLWISSPCRRSVSRSCMSSWCLPMTG